MHAGDAAPAGAPKILVVDDDAYMRRFIQIILERGGYTMIKADSGEQAMELAAREQPCLVIMDAMMPKMDGLTALRLLKQQAATRQTPVILLTANPHKFTREDAQLSGATVFLTKPFSPTRLLDEIRRLISVAAPPASSAAPEATG